MKSFRAYNIPGDKPLEYAITTQLSPKMRFCVFENLPKVRAILSYNNPPPPDEPDFTPVYGNVLDARIQIDTLKLIPFVKVLKMAELKLPEELATVLDLSQPVPTLKPAELTLKDLKAVYQEKVPAHRFGFTQVKKLVAKPAMIEELAMAGYAGTFAELGIDIGKLIDSLLKTDGDTSYEELTCVGWNPNGEALTGVIKAKLPYGYNGNLCTKGSYEYVAFWEWDQIESVWLYLGTAAVNIHDIKEIPPEGLQYSVFLPADLTHHIRPCTQGASIVKIRAILSWQQPPPPSNPHWIPTWGNREETLIHISPGPHVGPDEQIPYIYHVGNIGVCDIDQDTGLATGDGIVAAFTAKESPFGGTVTISGKITNPPHVLDGAKPIRYKVFVRPYDPYKTDVENPWQPLANTFGVKVVEQRGSNPPTMIDMPQKIDGEGYYEYLEDLYTPDSKQYRDVLGRVLAKWHTGTNSGMWEIRIEAKKPDGTVVPGGAIDCSDGSTRSIVRLFLDNQVPDPSIAITGYQRDPDPAVHPVGTGTPEKCGKFLIGDVIHGTYAVSDEHFGELTLTVYPVAPANGATVKPAHRAYNIVPTTGESSTWSLETRWKVDSGWKEMEECGYIVRLWARDRTVVNSGFIGWRNSDDVGFCLEKAKGKPEKEPKKKPIGGSKKPRKR